MKASDLKAGAVTSRSVRDGILGPADFSGGLPTGPQGRKGDTGPAGPATGAAGGDLTGSYPAPQLGAGVVGPDETGPAPAARVGASGAPEIPPSAGVLGTIPWTTESFEVGDMHDPASPTRTTQRTRSTSTRTPTPTSRPAGSGSCPEAGIRDGLPRPASSRP